MRNSVAVMTVLCLLAACDGNPFVTDDTVVDEPTPDPNEEPIDPNDDPSPDPGDVANPIAVPPEIARNLRGITYDPVAKRLFVEIAALDGTPDGAEFFRDTAAETNLPAGFEVYRLQEDPLDRFFRSVVTQSSDGTVTAAVAGDGGQFGAYFMGGWYTREGNFDKPAIGAGPGEGQVSYAGNYVGIDNWSGHSPTLPAGADGSLQMEAPGLVTGQMFFNVNFSDMQLNGSIFDREAAELGMQLPTVIIAPTAITQDGAFGGGLLIGADGVGNISGLFAGQDSIYMAGSTAFIPLPTNPETFEQGVFVLTQCGMNGEDAALCNGTAP